MRAEQDSLGCLWALGRLQSHEHEQHVVLLVGRLERLERSLVIAEPRVAARHEVRIRHATAQPFGEP
jgi:hypothetical protein